MSLSKNDDLKRIGNMENDNDKKRGLSPEEKIAKIEKREEQLKNQRLLLEAQQKKQTRKQDARRKIIMGGLAFAYLEDEQLEHLVAQASVSDQKLLREYLSKRKGRKPLRGK